MRNELNPTQALTNSDYEIFINSILCQRHLNTIDNRLCFITRARELRNVARLKYWLLKGCADDALLGQEQRDKGKVEKLFHMQYAAHFGVSRALIRG